MSPSGHEVNCPSSALDTLSPTLEIRSLGDPELLVDRSGLKAWIIYHDSFRRVATRISFQNSLTFP